MKHGAPGDAPMAWAVRGDTLRAVHVSQLQRKIENGLKCNCLCPECGSRLVAVKAGFNSGDYYHKGARRPHFRHHDVQQQPGCRSSTARKVALELLVTRDEIDLPAPRVSDSVVGISGTNYEGKAFGARSTEKVLHHHWVDRQKAILELESGRKIAVVLVAHTTVDDVKGIDGVLLIEGDDPELANMNVTEVLDQLRLDGKWLRWIKHWDDDALKEKAVQEALNSAQNAIDVWPADLVMPEGLTRLQQRETVLHWALKEALAKVDALFVPSKFESIPFKRSNGALLYKEWVIPAAKLKLSNIRLEYRMKGIIPDVICSAFDPAGNLGHPSLLIEVAVTHKVDPEKRRKIIEAGLACLELDAGQLAVSGRIHRQDLAKIVSVGKALSWVYHPEIERLKHAAQASLREHLDSLDRRERDEAEYRVRLARAKSILSETKIESLYRYLLNGLRAQWVGMEPMVTIDEGVEVNVDDVISAIRRLSPKFSYSEALMARGGVLDFLNSLAIAAPIAKKQALLMGRLRSAYSAPDDESKYITLLFYVYRARIVTPTESQKEELAMLMNSVKTNLYEGNLQYARPNLYDDFIKLSVPWLRGVFSEKGTEFYALSRRRAIQKGLIEEELTTSRTKAEKEARKETIDQQERFVKERNEMIHRMSLGGWSALEGIPHDLDQALHLASRLRCFMVNRDDLIAAAWRARQDGISLRKFYENLDFNNHVAFIEVDRILKEAYLKI